jgi:hypothetical protein
LREIERNVANAMGAVDDTQDTEMATYLGQGFEWHADPWQGGDGVEDAETWIVAGASLLLHACSERGCEEGVGDWVGVLDFYCFHWRGFGQVCYRFLACAVDGGEINYLVFGLERKVAQDGIDASGGIWDVCDCFNGCIEIIGDGSSGFI